MITLIEVKVARAVNKTVNNNKIVQFYPINCEFILSSKNDDNEDYDNSKEFEHLISKHATTTITQKTETINNNNNKFVKFQSFRRFSQFLQLYKLVTSKDIGARLPQFPKKTLNVTEIVSEERRVEFEKILNLVLSDRKLIVLKEVCNFIGIEEYPRGIFTNIKENFEIIQQSTTNKKKSGGEQQQREKSSTPKQPETTTTTTSGDMYGGYDSWEEETPIMTSSYRRTPNDKSLEEFHLASAALHKTIALSPSPIRGFPPTTSSENIDKIIDEKSENLQNFVENNIKIDETTNRFTIDGPGAREAIKLGDSKSLEQILNNGFDPNWRDNHGFTLLMLAAMFNQKACVLNLLQRGASRDLVNRDDETAIDLAPVSLAQIIRNYIHD